MECRCSYKNIEHGSSRTERDSHQWVDSGPNRPEPFFNLEEGVNNVAMRVRNAGSMSEVFTYLGINDGLDVLDVL